VTGVLVLTEIRQSCHGKKSGYHVLHVTSFWT